MLVIYALGLPNGTGFIQRQTFTCTWFTLMGPHWHPCNGSGSFSDTRPGSGQAAGGHVAPHRHGDPQSGACSLYSLCATAGKGQDCKAPQERGGRPGSGSTGPIPRNAKAHANACPRRLLTARVPSARLRPSTTSTPDSPRPPGSSPSLQVEARPQISPIFWASPSLRGQKTKLILCSMLWPLSPSE